MASPQSLPEVILIHGMWGCGATLEAIAEALKAEGYPVHLPTLPFHKAHLSNEERKQLGACGIAEYRIWLQQYIEGMNLERPPILVGHSMGGLLAQHLAATIPCERLILLAPANPAGINCITPWGILTSLNVLLHIVTRNPVHRPWNWLQSYCLLNDIPKVQRGAIHPSFLQESTKSYVEIVFWFLKRNRPSAVDSTAVKCPVLLIAGKKDRLIRPGVMRKIAKRYPQCTAKFLPDHGHMMVLAQRSQEVSTCMLDWIKSSAE